jgi:hypothetical protein
LPAFSDVDADEPGPRCREGFPEHGLKIFGAVYLLRRHAIALRDFHYIDPWYIHAMNIPADLREITEGFQRGVIAVAKNNEDDGRFVLNCAP